MTWALENKSSRSVFPNSVPLSDPDISGLGVFTDELMLIFNYKVWLGRVWKCSVLLCRQEQGWETLLKIMRTRRMCLSALTGKGVYFESFERSRMWKIKYWSVGPKLWMFKYNLSGANCNTPNAQVLFYIILFILYFYNTTAWPYSTSLNPT